MGNTHVFKPRESLNHVTFFYWAVFEIRPDHWTVADESPVGPAVL